MFRPLVVTGERRSGTNLVVDLLGDQEDITVLRDFLHLARIKRHLHIPSLTTTLSIEQRRRVVDLFERQSALLVRQLDLDWDAFERLPIEPWGDLLSLHRRILETVARAGDLIVGHKTTMAMSVVPELLEANPDCLAIVAIRDPRDAVASSRRHVPGVDVHDGIEGWRGQYRRLRRLQRRAELARRVLVVRYERLVADPQAELDAIARFLDVPRMWVPPSLDGLGSLCLGEDPIDYLLEQSLIDDPDGTGPASEPEAPVVEAALGRLMRAHGYEPVRSPRPTATLAYTGGLLRRQATRTARRTAHAVIDRVRPIKSAGLRREGPLRTRS